LRLRHRGIFLLHLIVNEIIVKGVRVVDFSFAITKNAINVIGMTVTSTITLSSACLRSKVMHQSIELRLDDSLNLLLLLYSHWCG